MLTGKLKKAVERTRMLDILTSIREVLGVDFKLEMFVEDRVGIYFMFDGKEHYMILDDIVFNESLSTFGKTNKIVNELLSEFKIKRRPSIKTWKKYLF